MTFRETLQKHLQAIQSRDLPALAETLPKERLTLIQSNGQLVETVREFLELHRGWFAVPTWALEVRPVNVLETPDLGVAVLHLTYTDTPACRPPIHETSFLTLLFARRGDRWEMIHDQNTPIKKP